MLNFLRKKHAKIQKNSRPVGEDTLLAAAWKLLKFSSSRRRRDCIFWKKLAATAQPIGLHLYLFD
jgi:hypothetical protein